MSSKGGASRGFTLVELMFGVIFTCMVLGALTALLLAMLANWRDSENRAWLPQAAGTSSTASALYSSVQRFDYIDFLVKNAKYLGWADRENNGSDSAAIIWATDDSRPGTMEVGEVRVLEFDSATKTLRMWYVPPDAAGSQSAADLTMKYNDIDGENDVKLFKDNASVTSQVLLRSVVDFAPKVVLNPVDPNARPALEYLLTVQEGSGVVGQYHTSTLRAPAQAPQ